MGEAIGEPGGL